jgi:hypothetical protein
MASEEQFASIALELVNLDNAGPKKGGLLALSFNVNIVHLDQISAGNIGGAVTMPMMIATPDDDADAHRHRHCHRTGGGRLRPGSQCS